MPTRRTRWNPKFIVGSLSLKTVLILTSFIGATSSFCENQEDCEDFMICLNNVCMCDDSGESFSDLEQANNPTVPNYKTSCRKSALIGDQCDNRTMICLTDSICTPEGICQCPIHLEETRLSRECQRPYDYPCDETKLCNPEKFLSCQRDEDLTGKRVCRCHNEQEMTFDPLKNSCVGLAGQLCELREWMGIQLGCVENAYCYKNDPLEEFYGVCKCKPGFVQAEPFPECEPIHGKACLAFPHQNCADGFNLECLQNTCQCRSGSTFDQRDHQCKLIHGSRCEEVTSGCVQNAECSRSYNSDWDFKCQCSPGYVSTSTGQCQLGPQGYNCSSDLNPCHSESGLVCTDGICQCGNSTVLDSSTKSCRGLHGSSCSLKEPSCTKNSFCNDESTCQCEDSFHITEEGCEISYGSKCNFKYDIVDPCPIDKGLSCQDFVFNGTVRTTGFCSCVDKQTVFDKLAGRCLFRVDEHCNPPLRKCVTNAFCGVKKNCQCYSQYSSTPDGNCLIDYFQPCLTSDNLSAKVCNVYLGLECINNICNCSMGTIYNEPLTKCVHSNAENKYNTQFGDQGVRNSSVYTEEHPLDKKYHSSDNNGEDFKKNNISPTSYVLYGVVIVSVMIIVALLLFAVGLNLRLQRKYHSVTS